MKKILSILFIAMALASCSQTEDVKPAMGSVTVELSKRAASPELVTRAVDDDLQVDVLSSDGTVLYHFDEGEATAALNALMLPAATYTLRAYTANHDAEYSSAERGEAKYYGETTFQVLPERHIRLGLQVPMTNFAVTFSVPDDITSRFTNIRLTLVHGDRTQMLVNGETAYFELTPAADLAYTLEMTNADGEMRSQDKYLKAADQKAGTHYTVTYQMGE